MLKKLAPSSLVYIHQDDADFFQITTNINPLRIHPTVHNEQLRIGRHQITFIHTPGHTPGSQCVWFSSPNPTSTGSQSTRLLTGDTLFPYTCGRMDLIGGSQNQMYDSLQHVLTSFPDDTVIYPGHWYGGRVGSLVGTEKKRGLLASISPQEWAQRFPSA